MPSGSKRFSTISARRHRGQKCKAMEGLVEEGKQMIDEDAAPEVKDAGLIAAAQRVEHYEIAGYGTACTFAQILGHTEAEKMLHDTLQEERETDEKLRSWRSRKSMSRHNPSTARDKPSSSNR